MSWHHPVVYTQTDVVSGRWQGVRGICESFRIDQLKGGILRSWASSIHVDGIVTACGRCMITGNTKEQWILLQLSRGSFTNWCNGHDGYQLRFLLNIILAWLAVWGRQQGLHWLLTWAKDKGLRCVFYLQIFILLLLTWHMWRCESELFRYHFFCRSQCI